MRRAFGKRRPFARGLVAANWAMAAGLAIAPLALADQTIAPTAPADRGPCASREFEETRYVVCRAGAPPAKGDMRLYLNDETGAPYGHFARLAETLEARGERLVFAMNAGMYARDRSPVGLYVEDGETLKSANTNDGPGNFHLKPNGVFFVDADGAPGVMETGRFLASGRAPAFATQSGPMLVIDGAIHPRFLPASTSRKRRNGVGVTEDGEAVFVLADAPVNFHEFAVFFRDEIGAPNALYLDGTISRLYAPNLDRNDPGAPMGPIVSLVASE